jgi:hypothetical protein
LRGGDRGGEGGGGERFVFVAGWGGYPSPPPEGPLPPAPLPRSQWR